MDAKRQRTQSHPASSTTTPAKKKDCYLFVGNPGTGKSTLINGVIGEPLFRSGVSFDGAGITYKFDHHEVPGLGVMMDTPGLGDEKMKEQAAEAITKALKQNGFYRVFFVLTEESGRVRPADKTTMKLILSAAPIDDYSVIVNKVEADWLEHMKNHPEDLKKWITTLMSGLPKVTASIHIVCRQETLAAKKDVKYKADQDVINFIKQAPGMDINPEDVNTVTTDDFAQLEKEYEGLREQLENDKEAMGKEMKKQKEEMTKALERADAAAAKVVQDEKNEILGNALSGLCKLAVSELCR